MRRLALACVILLSAAPPALAEEAYPATVLLSTGTNVTGETIRYPAVGAAKVTSLIVTIAPGAETVTHRHPTPMFAYILDGEVTVDYGAAAGRRTYRAGEAFMEAMAVTHRGVNTGTVPVRILTVSMGAEGMADVDVAK